MVRAFIKKTATLRAPSHRHETRVPDNRISMEEQATKRAKAPLMPVSEIVSQLSEMIGPKFVAYATSVTEPYVIQDWINGKTVPSDETRFDDIRNRTTLPL